MLNKAFSNYGQVKQLTSEQVWEIHEGRFGRSVPVDLIKDICEDFDVQVDLNEYEACMKDKQANLHLHWWKI